MVRPTRMLLAVGLAVTVGLAGVSSAAEARLVRAAGTAAPAAYVAVDYWYGPGYGYPYPYRYGPPVYVAPPVYAPPVYVPPPVYVVPPAPGPAAPQSWYYCDNPQGYYPNVPSCSHAWRQVPVKPPQ